MLGSPLMLVLLHPHLDDGIPLDWKIGNLADDQPLRQPSLEVESFPDIGADENEVVSRIFKELSERGFPTFGV